MWNKSLKKISKVGPTAKKIDNSKKKNIINLKLLLITKGWKSVLFIFKVLENINFDILNPIKAIAIPPIISVMKCAPTTTLLNDITNAKKKIKYFNFGAIKEITNATTKIVEVCPEGKEWKLESSVKNFRLTSFSKFSVFGLGRPKTCLINCVIIPELKIDKNKRKL